MSKKELNNDVVPSLDEARNYIYSIDFSLIIDKLVNHEEWLKNDAKKTCQMYRNFLFLNKKYWLKHSLTPSEDIDEFWHHHILDTAAYAKDCQAIFGTMMHHYPYFGIDGITNQEDMNKSFEITKELYIKEFGEPLQPTKSGYPKLFYFLMKKIPIFDIT